MRNVSCSIMFSTTFHVKLDYFSDSAFFRNANFLPGPKIQLLFRFESHYCINSVHKQYCMYSKWICLQYLYREKRMCRIAVLRSWSRSEPRVFDRIRSRNFWLIKTLKRTFEAYDELWAKSRCQSRRNSKTWSRRRQKTLGFATLPRIGSNQCELHFALVRFSNAVSVAVLWSTPDKFRNTVSVTVLCMVITRHV